MAEASHRRGVRNFDIGFGSGGIEVKDPLPGTWRASPFALGDVVIFHSLLVHKALPNTTEHIRMSVDARYQLANQPICERSLLPYADIASWEDVYSGWCSEDFKHYWSDQELDTRPVDRAFYVKRDAMAFDAVEKGDVRALPILFRIASGDPDSVKRKKASKLVQTLQAQQG